MTKPVVFLFHGMGINEDGWEKPILAQLNAVLKDRGYNFFKGKTIEDVVDFVPIGYDDVLRKQIASWEQVSADMSKDPHLHGDLKDLFAWVNSLEAGNKKYILSHAMDVILYRFHSPTRFLILTRAIEKMAQKIDSVLSTAANTPISVMAHSLGTAVATDAMQQLGTRGWGGKPSAFAPNLWRFTSVATIANVSRLLATDNQENTIVRPGPTGESGSYCMMFLNFHHELDPITWLQPFSTDKLSQERTRDYMVRHYHAFDVHDWKHYLLNPQVHIPIVNSSLGMTVISNDEEHTAENTFAQVGGEFQGALDKANGLRQELKGVVDSLKSPVTPKSLVQAAAKFFHLIDRYSSELAPEGGPQ